MGHGDRSNPGDVRTKLNDPWAYRGREFGSLDDVPFLWRKGESLASIPISQENSSIRYDTIYTVIITI